MNDLVERLRVRWEATDEPTMKKINRILRERTEAADRIEALSAALAASQVREAKLREAAERITPYLRWTISEESPGYHPTMPSAVAAFDAALRALSQESSK